MRERDRGPVPRLKEQHKDNAAEAIRDDPVKAHFQKEKTQSKQVKIKELEESHCD